MGYTFVEVTRTDPEDSLYNRENIFRMKKDDRKAPQPQEPFGVSASIMRKDLNRTFFLCDKEEDLKLIEARLAKLRALTYVQGDFEGGSDLALYFANVRRVNAEKNVPGPLVNPEAHRAPYLRKDGTLGGFALGINPADKNFFLSIVKYPEKATSYDEGIVKVFFYKQLGLSLLCEKAKTNDVLKDPLLMEIKNTLDNDEIYEIVETFAVHKGFLLKPPPTKISGAGITMGTVELFGGSHAFSVKTTDVTTAKNETEIFNMIEIRATQKSLILNLINYYKESFEEHLKLSEHFSKNSKLKEILQEGIKYLSQTEKKAISDPRTELQNLKNNLKIISMNLAEEYEICCKEELDSQTKQEKSVKEAIIGEAARIFDSKNTMFPEEQIEFFKEKIKKIDVAVIKHDAEKALEALKLVEQNESTTKRKSFISSAIKILNQETDREGVRLLSSEARIGFYKDKLNEFEGTYEYIEKIKTINSHIRHFNESLNYLNEYSTADPNVSQEKELLKKAIDILEEIKKTNISPINQDVNEALEALGQVTKPNEVTENRKAIIREASKILNGEDFDNKGKLLSSEAKIELYYVNNLNEVKEAYKYIEKIKTISYTSYCNEYLKYLNGLPKSAPFISQKKELIKEVMNILDNEKKKDSPSLGLEQYEYLSADPNVLQKKDLLKKAIDILEEIKKTDIDLTNQDVSEALEALDQVTEPNEVTENRKAIIREASKILIREAPKDIEGKLLSSEAKIELYVNNLNEVKEAYEYIEKIKTINSYTSYCNEYLKYLNGLPKSEPFVSQKKELIKEAMNILDNEKKKDSSSLRLEQFRAKIDTIDQITIEQLKKTCTEYLDHLGGPSKQDEDLKQPSPLEKIAEKKSVLNEKKELVQGLIDILGKPELTQENKFKSFQDKLSQKDEQHEFILAKRRDGELINFIKRVGLFFAGVLTLSLGSTFVYKKFFVPQSLVSGLAMNEEIEKSLQLTKNFKKAYQDIQSKSEVKEGLKNEDKLKQEGSEEKGMTDSGPNAVPPPGLK